MSLPLLPCPHCQTVFRTTRPVPPGTQLHCPACQSPFVPGESRGVTASPRLIGPPFFIAVGVALTLGLSIIAAALIYASRAEPTGAPPVASHPDGSAAYKAELDKARQELDRQKQHLDATRLVARGEAALASNLFTEAEQAFEAALKLAPDLPEAVKGLVSARTALAVTKKTGEDQAQRLKSVAKLLADGKKAITDKRWAVAVQALESARQLDPTHADTLAALAEARAALDADKMQQQALADFRKHMDEGRAAMKAERFADAVKEYLAAARLMPDDLEAQQGQKQAENRLAALADKQKRQEAFDGLLERGKTALRETRFTDAIASLEAAGRLMADDKESQRLLRDAKQSLKRVKSANAKLLAGANEAIRLGRVDEAKRLADEAVRNWAEDAQAKKAQANADRLVENQKAAQDAFLRLTQQASLAMTNLRYADAISSYTEALRLVPNDALVLRELRLARLALAQEVQARRDADTLIRRGRLELGRQAYSEAERTFRLALRKAPDDLQASTGLSQARYGRFMVEGQAAYRLRKKAEAVRAFEAALAEKPGDQLASNALRQARAMR